MGEKTEQGGARGKHLREIEKSGEGGGAIRRRKEKLSGKKKKKAEGGLGPKTKKKKEDEEIRVSRLRKSEKKNREGRQ